jgi:murein DD-endopeptidase MepM/ murein hydrolase activator NlpD
MWSEQCPVIDAAFGSAPHRHPVSHFVWGDHVKSALAEDLILTARRRLLGYYGAGVPGPRARFRGIALASPLDGVPRMVTGVMGEARGGGRVHAGIDLLANLGEPVRAMANGTVVFAGVDLRHRGLQTVEPDRTDRIPLERMGARGLFVRVDHGRGVHSLYVHFQRYTVRTGDAVRQGEVLGYVGRTGMHTSDAHLHLGLFDGETVVDPLPHLQPFVIAADAAPAFDTEMQPAPATAER